MSGPTRRFSALICAPVPVGHRVEASWLLREDGGFLGASEKQFAHVVDLDTGIAYGEMECFVDVQGVRQGETIELPLTVRSDLPVVERVRGRVAACQVATLGFTDTFVQTTLVIEPEG